MPDQTDDDREVLAESLCEHDDHPWVLPAPVEADHYGRAEHGYPKADGLRTFPFESDLPGEPRAREYLEAIVAMPFRIRPINEAASVAVDRILHPETFEALAGMLGYVKAEVRGVEHGVRYWEGSAGPKGGQRVRVMAEFESEDERQAFYLHCIRMVEQWNADTPGHRMPELVTRKTVHCPWDVV